MANNRSIIIIAVLLTILSLVGSFAINIASSNLPASWTPYLWLAYPVSGIIAVLTIVLVVRQGLLSIPTPPPLPRPAYVHEGWFLKHYYLAQADFTGRKTELDFLTNWLEQKNNKPLLVLRALGGFGKSALVWHWLNNETSPKGLTKVVWWAFYDDNSFETFLNETLDYLDIDPKALSLHEQVEMLARYVHQNKILIVMDGFERALRAYNSMNAAYQGDETTNEITNNQCVSIHAGNFLQRVASLNAQGRVLLTTRLLPDDLKIKQSGNLLASCAVYNLDRLSKEDAVAFFRKQNIKGTHTEIESACEVYGYHPLSLRLLAGRIASGRSRDIKLAEKFKIDADLKGRQNHILKVAYESLPRPRRLLLSKISAFRSPMDFEAIRVFDIKPNWLDRLFYGPQDLQMVLNDFVTRGLVHHDPTKDKYDLHPIVRRYTYDRLTAADRTGAHERLVNYFEAVPTPEKVNTLEDLAPVIELYHHMARAGKLDEAFVLFRDRLHNQMYYQFGAYQTVVELLIALFLDGEDKPPRLKYESDQAWTLNSLANVYSMSGQPRRAVPLFLLGNKPDEDSGNKLGVAIGLECVAEVAQLPIGLLKEAEHNLRRCIDLFRELDDDFYVAVGHQELGHVLLYRGAWQDAEQELAAAIAIEAWKRNLQGYGVNFTYHALCFLLMARDNPKLKVVNLKSAIESAGRALELANETARTSIYVPRDYIRAYWLLGAAYRANDELDKSEENLSKAISICRQINLAEMEADILLELAKLSYARHDFKDAREKAEEALTITERCGYVLQGADVNLFLAQYALEQEKDKAKAKQYAETALMLATCDGPPYYYKVAYHEAEKSREKLK